MLRRDFLALTAAVTLAFPLVASAGEAYSPEYLKAELAAGKTVLLDFKASWCSTCAAQERVIESLVEQNPAYGDQISFIDVDWDQWGGGDLVKQLNIPRRSTLVVLKGDAELGRIVAGTAKDEIKALLDIAAQAAAS